MTEKIRNVADALFRAVSDRGYVLCEEVIDALYENLKVMCKVPVSDNVVCIEGCVFIPSSVTEITPYELDGISADYLIFPRNVRRVCSGTFLKTYRFDKVCFLNPDTVLEEGALHGMSTNEFAFPDNMTTVKSLSFNKLWDINEFVGREDTISIIKRMLMISSSRFKMKIVFPSKCRHIEKYAFWGLQDVVLRGSKYDFDIDPSAFLGSSDIWFSDDMLGLRSFVEAPGYRRRVGFSYVPMLCSEGEHMVHLIAMAADMLGRREEILNELDAYFLSLPCGDFSFETFESLQPIIKSRMFVHLVNDEPDAVLSQKKFFNDVFDKDFNTFMWTMAFEPEVLEFCLENHVISCAAYNKLAVQFFEFGAVPEVTLAIARHGRNYGADCGFPDGKWHINYDIDIPGPLRQDFVIPMVS